MYKTLGFKWLHEVFCPASAFATADRNEARNPQRFIHVTVRLSKNPFSPQKKNSKIFGDNCNINPIIMCTFIA